MSEQTLKTSPFCGSKDDIVIFSDEGRHNGLCWACLAETKHCDTKEEALNAWNRRTP